MVRVCAVEGCLSSDITHLAHRFPKDVARAKEWQEVLELQGKDIDVLMEKYTVCTLHFEKRDYRNIESRHLNKTAMPKLETSFWTPPRKEKTFAISIDVNEESDKNSLHVNIIDPKGLAIETFDEEDTVHTIDQEEVEELEEEEESVYEALSQGKSVDVVRKIKANDRGEYYIVVEEEEDLGEELKPRKRKNLSVSPLKSKKPCLLEAHDPPPRIIMPEEVPEEYDFVEKIYQEVSTQTEEEEEEVDEEVLNSDYWGCSKADLILTLLERDEKCKELEKKVQDFKQAKEKMLQSIEMLKMM